VDICSSNSVWNIHICITSWEGGEEVHEKYPRISLYKMDKSSPSLVFGFRVVVLGLGLVGVIQFEFKMAQQKAGAVGHLHFPWSKGKYK
jgi:hypothetical protein